MKDPGSSYLALENQALRDRFVQMRKLLERAADHLEANLELAALRHFDEQAQLVKDLRKAAEL